MGDDSSESDDVRDLLDRVENETEGKTVSVRDVVDALGQRAFGSLFVLTALVAILPTGAIPGMSILTGTIMLLLSVQLLFGAKSIWLPAWIMRRSIKRDRLVSSMDKAKGVAGKIDAVVGPRLEFMVNPPFLQMVAIAGIIVSISMYPLAVVPFGAFPAGLSLLVIGLGLMMRDGILIMIGTAIGLIGLWIAYTAAPI